MTRSLEMETIFVVVFIEITIEISAYKCPVQTQKATTEDDLREAYYFTYVKNRLQVSTKAKKIILNTKEDVRMI